VDDNTSLENDSRSNQTSAPFESGLLDGPNTLRGSDSNCFQPRDDGFGTSIQSSLQTGEWICHKVLLEFRRLALVWRHKPLKITSTHHVTHKAMDGEKKKSVPPGSYSQASSLSQAGSASPLPLVFLNDCL